MRVFGIFVHQDEVGGRNRIGLFARSVGNHQREVLHVAPFGRSGSSFDRFLAGHDEVASAVADGGVIQLVGDGVGQLNVTDRAFDLLGVRSDAFIAFATDTGRPLHGRAFADLIAPVQTHFRQVVDEVEGGAGAVGTVHHGDFLARECHARIDGGDGGIVPVGDFTEEDVGDNRPGQFHATGFDARNIDDRNHGTHDRGKLGQAGSGQIAGFQRGIGRAEINRRRFDLGNTATGTDGLVVDLVFGGFIVVRRPFRHGRKDEGSPGAGDFGGVGNHASACQRQCENRGFQGIEHVCS